MLKGSKNKNEKKHHYTKEVFFTKSQNHKRMETEIVFVFWVIIFEPNKIYTYLAPQNDRLNHSFVKDIHAVGKKMTKKWS